MKDDIFYIREEVSSIIQAALADVAPDSYKQKLIQAVHECKKPRGLLYCELLISLCIFSLALCLIMLFDNGNGLSWPLFIIMLIAFVINAFISNRFSSKYKHQFLSKSLLKDGYRPNMCVICFTDLRYSDKPVCPTCGEPLAPPKEEHT
ncbi:MAG: hypothetical protein AAGI37_08170 [Planctomycetota bacterium]